MSPSSVTNPAALGTEERTKLLDLSKAGERELIAAFADEGIVRSPPLLPANMPGAIEANRKLLSGATGVIDAWRFGGDSRLAPLCARGLYHPDLMTVLSAVNRMISTVIANHEIMAQLFPKKTCGEKQA